MSYLDEALALREAEEIAARAGDDPYLYVTLSDYRANMLHYMNMIADGTYKGLILKRYDRAVAAVLPMGGGALLHAG